MSLHFPHYAFILVVYIGLINNYLFIAGAINTEKFVGIKNILFVIKPQVFRFDFRCAALFCSSGGKDMEGSKIL